MKLRWKEATPYFNERLWDVCVSFPKGGAWFRRAVVTRHIVHAEPEGSRWETRYLTEFHRWPVHPGFETRQQAMRAWRTEFHIRQAEYNLEHT